MEEIIRIMLKRIEEVTLEKTEMARCIMFLNGEVASLKQSVVDSLAQFHDAQTVIANLSDTIAGRDADLATVRFELCKLRDIKEGYREKLAETNRDALVWRRELREAKKKLRAKKTK